MKSFAKRILSAFLSVVVIFNGLGMSVFASGEIGENNGRKTVKLGKIIAENYDWLNEEEKAILSSDALIGDSYTVNYPEKAEELITLNTADKTITAANFADGENVWVPSSAKIIYQNSDGTDANPIYVKLDENGFGSFSCPSDRYRAEVEYTVYANVPADVQKAFVNYPDVLVEGITNIESLRLLRHTFMALGDNIDDLNALTTGEYKFGDNAIAFREDTAPYIAIKTMYNQCKADDANGQLKITNMLNEFYRLTADGKLRFLIENGAEFKAEADLIYKCTKDITESSTTEMLLNIAKNSHPDFYNRALLGLDTLNDIKSVLSGVIGNAWNILNVNPVRADASAAETAELASAVAAAYTASVSVSSKVHKYDNPELSEQLKIASTVLTIGVDQYKVNVAVRASVIAKGSVDKNELTTLNEEAGVSLVLDKDASAAAVLSAIENSGVKNEALDRWAEIYNGDYAVNEDNYDIEISEIPNALNEDIDVIIRYVPKKYTVSLGYAEDCEVYYGYNLLLPKHADAEKSYDYTVNNVLHREDTVYTVTGNTVISRREAKATSKYSIPSAVISGAVSGVSLTAEEKAVLSSGGLNADNVWYRMPDSSVGLVNVEVIGNTDSGVAYRAVGSRESGVAYKVTASDYSTGLLSGAVWSAVSGKAVAANGKVVAEFEVNKGAAEFVTADSFDHVEVVYNAVVSDISNDEINKWINAPKQLKEEAIKQCEAIEPLTSKDILNNLNEVKESMFTAISSIGSDETKLVIDRLLNENSGAFADSTLKLYTYLNNYVNSGLSYYYRAGVYENMNEQLKLLQESFEAMWKDAKLQEVLERDYPNYKTRLENVRGILESANLVGVNALINRYDNEGIAKLVSALDSLKTVHSYNAGNAPLVLSAVINGDAPDRTSVTITVQKVDGKGELSNTVNGALSFDTGAVYTENDIADLNALKEALENSLNIDKAHYTSAAEGALPKAGDTVNSPVNVIYTWLPKVYTVKADDAEMQFSAGGLLSVMLPKWDGVAGYRYTYIIGDERIAVGSEAVEYTFKNLAAVDALADENGIINIKREVVDIYRENVIGLVNSLNKTIADNKLTFSMGGQNCLMAAFIPLENKETGELSIVLRVSPQNIPSMKDTLTNTVYDAVTDILNSSFTYIGFNGEAFWGNGQITLQTLINAVLSNDLSFDYICDIISENGDLKEITQVIPSLANSEVIGVGKDGMIDVAGSKISHFEALGAKLISVNAQFGANATNARNVPFYVTMEDFDLRAGSLKKVESAVKKVQNYVDVKTESGKLLIDLRAPESLYAYYMTAQTIAGNADISDINAMDLGQSLEYDFNLIKGLIEDDSFTVKTLERTLAKLGKTKDLSEYATVFNMLRKAAAYIIKNGTVTGSSVNSTYKGNVSFSIRDLLLNKLNIDETIAGAVTESAEGTALNADFELKIKNMDTEYDAMIVDVNASGLKKLTYTKDLAAAAASLHDKSVIVLLSDVNLKSDLIINSTAVIDLNGKMINGNVTAGKTVYIADSRLSTYTTGGINGKVSGNARIIGGRYTSNITSMLKDGYVQDANGYVVNKLYTVSENGSDINISLNADFLKTENIPDIKTYLADLAADLAVNMYPNAYFSVDGNVIYSVGLEDVFSVLDLTKGEMVQKVIDMADLGGISAFVNALLSDVTDFAGMQQALISGKPLASYKTESKPWDLKLRLAGGKNDNYLTADVVSGADVTERTVNIYVKDSASSDSPLALLLGSLADVVKVNALNVSLNSITYTNRSLSVDAKATADVLVDLSHNPDYAFVIAALLANSANGSLKAELISALELYQSSGLTADMKTAIEKADTALIIKAVNSIKSADFAKVLAKLGVESEGAVALEAIYHDLLNIASVLSAKSGITGGSGKLSSHAVDGEYATYSISRTNWHKCDVRFTLKLLGEDKPIVVKDSMGIIKLVTDNLNEAFESCGSQYTVYVNGAAALTKDVNIFDSISIVGANNIDFAGKQIFITAEGITVTSDKEIDAFVASGIEKYSVEKSFDNGKYIYRLKSPEIPPIVLKQADGSETEYKAEELAKALAAANDGAVITVNTAVEMTEDTVLSKAGTIEIVNADKIAMNGKTVTLGNKKAILVTDSALEHSSVISGVAKYEVDRAEENGKFIYALKKQAAAIVVTHMDGSVTEYDDDELAKAVKKAVDGDIINVCKPVALNADAELTGSIRIQNAANIDMNGHKINLSAENVKLITDADMDGFVASGVTDYKLTVNNIGNEYTYALEQIVVPKIPAITVRHSNGDTVDYTADELAKAIEEAADGDIIIINESVTLGRDAEVTKQLEIAGAEKIDMNGKKLVLKAAAASLTADSELTVEAGLADYELGIEPADGKIVYTLKAITYKIIVKDSNGSIKIKYRNDELATALKNASNGDTIEINDSVSLAETVAVTTEITVKNVDKISFGGNKIALTASASLTVDGDISANVSAPEYYEVKTETLSGGYKYTLAALEPSISVPTVNVQADGMIRGAKVDAANKYIYIDTAPEGLKVSNFSLVTFTTLNASSKDVKITCGNTVRAASDLVCTGDTVTVTASNTAGKTISVTYTVIVVGDTNCNGMIDAGDAVRMLRHYNELNIMEGAALLAADTNCNGMIDAGDAVKNTTKYNYMWDNKTYVSALSR